MTKRKIYITPLDRLNKPDLPWISSLDALLDAIESDESANTSILDGIRVDDFAPDIDARLDAEALLKKLPKRLIEIAQKRVDGDTLTKMEQKYLERQRRKLKDKL